MGKRFSFFLLLLVVVLMVANEKEFNLNFHQNDYHFTFERLELVRYNKDYVKEMSVVTFKYNRTQAVANWTFTFNIDFGNDLMLVIQAYTFLSNEYRLYPIRFEANFSKALTANTAGIRRMLTCGNLTGSRLLKGRKYHVCNFFTDEEKLPPFIPNGNYKFEVHAEYFSKEAFVTNAYATVTRPILWNF